MQELPQEGLQLVLSYSIPSSDQHLLISDAVISHISNHQQNQKGMKEAGGQLFARYCKEGILIEVATGPRPSDIRKIFSFLPDRKAERLEIEDFFRIGLHFVGDWHTHPEPVPVPSTTDVHSMKEMFKKSRHSSDFFIMLIAGTETLPKGLYVGICDGETMRQLDMTPSASCPSDLPPQS